MNGVKIWWWAFNLDGGGSSSSLGGLAGRMNDGRWMLASSDSKKLDPPQIYRFCGQAVDENLLSYTLTWIVAYQTAVVETLSCPMIMLYGRVCILKNEEDDSNSS
jgi:hypothetical protein